MPQREHPTAKPAEENKRPNSQANDSCGTLKRERDQLECQTYDDDAAAIGQKPERKFQTAELQIACDRAGKRARDRSQRGRRIPVLSPIIPGLLAQNIPGKGRE